MSQSAITLAFESYKAEQEANNTPVVLDEMVLALVPNQDPNAPIDRAEGLPPAEHIVYVADVSQSGFINPNAVVYSLIMDTTVGDFSFNWLGLRNKASGVIAAISHFPNTDKEKSVSGVATGNSITRSVLMGYSGAKSITGINVDASTWQIDFTARLFGMDERERLSNIDHYGHATFLTDGFQVQKNDSVYSANLGTGYVGGLRCHATQNITINDVVPSSGIYLDASFQGQLTSQWQTVVSLICSTTELINHVDDNGVQHYLTKIAEIDSAGNISDVRLVGGTGEFERVDNAATDADIDNESKEPKHLKLPQFWRGIQKYVLDKLWLSLAAKICPVGVPLPWGSDIAPEGFAIHKGQGFDVIANPELAKLYPDGIIPDMRGLGIVGKEDGELILAYEEGQVKEHGHPNSTVSSTNLGTKTSNTTGNHIHPYRWARGGVGGSGLYMERGETQRGYNTSSNNPVAAAGNHAHTVGIGSHAHSVMIALFGALKNTINHRKFNWIVRLA